MTVECVGETIAPMSPAGSHARAAASALMRASSLLTPLGIPERPLPQPDFDAAHAAFLEAVEQLEAGLAAASGLPGHAELEASLNEVHEGLYHLQTARQVPTALADVIENAWKGGELARKAIDSFEVPMDGKPDLPYKNPNGGIVPPWLKQRYDNGLPPFLVRDEAAGTAGTPPQAFVADAHRWANEAFGAIAAGRSDLAAPLLSQSVTALQAVATQFQGTASSTAATRALDILLAHSDLPETSAIGNAMDILAADLAAADWE